MLDALEIDGEDSVSIVEEVEAAFGITINDAEAAACLTVGDLFALVCAKVPIVNRSDHLPCLTASAFRAIRRAIRLQDPTCDIQPNTRLDSVIDRRDHRASRDYLASQTGLRFPAPSLQNFGTLFSGFVIAAGSVIVAMSFSVPSLYLGGFTGLLAAIAIGYRYGRWAWSEFDTVGDLARRASALSMSQAIRANGSVRRVEAWNALLAVISPFSQRTDDVGPRTRFFSERR